MRLPAIRVSRARAVFTTICVTAAAAALPAATAQARAIDDSLSCDQQPHAFISGLIDDQSIDAAPMRVEANSVNAFRPSAGSGLMAFGFRVYAVLGYAPGDELFKPGSGQPLDGTLYGVVLSGPKEAVESRVREAGSTATVRSVVPLVLTAVVCKQQQ
jgi:hypothetical protein